MLKNAFFWVKARRWDHKKPIETNFRHDEILKMTGYITQMTSDGWRLEIDLRNNVRENNGK